MFISAAAAVLPKDNRGIKRSCDLKIPPAVSNLENRASQVTTVLSIASFQLVSVFIAAKTYIRLLFFKFIIINLFFNHDE